MSTEQAPKPLPGVSRTPLPQLVPSQTCLTCGVCCRFPEPDSFLRPYFTSDEIRHAVGFGLDPHSFPDPGGSTIRVVPHPEGEGYLCPAFDPATSYCRVYNVRPLDCQIYPLAVMWNAERTQVMLGWDTKCPFLKQGEGERATHGGLALQAYAERIAGMIESDDKLKTFQTHPGLIGRFQDDVMVLRPLPRLTEALRQHLLTPFSHADRPQLEQALAGLDTPLAAYAYAPHAVWRALFSYWKAEIAGCLCLFAEHGDGLFMPLPPLGLGSNSRALARQVGLPTEALAQAFALMRKRNRGSGVSRIENVPDDWKPALEAAGYRVTLKDPEYLYRVSDLVMLTGDRFKSQRSAYNQFVRTHRFSYDSYRKEDEEECLALYGTWAIQQEARGLDPVARQMVTDAKSAHREALASPDELGLTGRVVRVDGKLRGYTFGCERSRSVFTVLLEVADRSVPGLAQFIFREFCREAQTQGYAFINTMDDSGLKSLARSKMAYRPWRLVHSAIVTQP